MEWLLSGKSWCVGGCGCGSVVIGEGCGWWGLCAATTSGVGVAGNVCGHEHRWAWQVAC